MPGDRPAPVDGAAVAAGGLVTVCSPTEVLSGGVDEQAAVNAMTARHARDSSVGVVYIP
jgi:hypothetical protein